jgi:hypothetical protein
MAATDMHATIGELLEAAFSVRSVPRLYNEDQLPFVVSPGRVRVESLERNGDRRVESESLQSVSQLRVAVAEVEDSSRTQRKRNVHCWKPLPSSTVKTVTETTGRCVIVISKV